MRILLEKTDELHGMSIAQIIEELARRVWRLSAKAYTGTLHC